MSANPDVREDAVSVRPSRVVVELRPNGSGIVTAAELADFARAATANVGPGAAIFVGSVLRAHEGITYS